MPSEVTAVARRRLDLRGTFVWLATLLRGAHGPWRYIVEVVDGNGCGAFVDKGRFSSLLERIPVLVILNDMTALLGAVRAAAEGSR